MTALAPSAPASTYDGVADASAALVIDSFSSSFGLASRLLGAGVRGEVRNIYALVRVADEVVDVPVPPAGRARQRASLDALEAEVLDALEHGSSTNLVVHAFARTARRCGIGPDLVVPFFASMRTDLDRSVHDEASLATYVYGSAEVVGLMCLRAFLADEPSRAHLYDDLAPGAQRLGAAFQLVNFVRDLAEDTGDLGRSYLPGLEPDGDAALQDPARDRWLDAVDGHLVAAGQVVPHLPRSSRLAVCAAHDLFGELSARLREVPVTELRRRRVSVPRARKARLVAAVVARSGLPRPAVRVLS
ncbi:squalene/phytoene synthase family protein [Nocardioides lentus]|uniref:Squalene/phytoene synthase family protein n=1 Tax=Nocardioides lentus TaxID=338077 RepID=A0ABN2NVW7_9ACTN